jgi:8-oxo-dGTP pyrophosphatase MutT (NUDIX family)
VNAYLILKQADNVLLLLRKNTGYADGLWSLVAGHVEDGESATAGMIREAKEETGIEISPSELRVAHIMHRPSNRMNIDIFFECSSWKGLIQNQEPEKCERLEFFALENLPSNMIEHIPFVLKAVESGQFYSEFGWE